MPDVWTTVSELDPAAQDRLADVLEVRGADPQQRALRREFLAAIPLPAEARVLEVGCSTGVLTRMLAQLPQVSRVTGVDIAPSLLKRAAALSAGLPDVTFEQGDARSLPFPDGGFDTVVVDSVLVHVPGAEAALGEALRVLRPGGWLAAFEGDYATTTVALGDLDPLQRCVDAMMSASVTDRWLVRRLPRLLADTGFTLRSLRSHGFVDTAPDGYMVTVVDRGADVLAATGQIGPELAAALKDEARRRGAAGIFFGHIAYASVMAQKPQPAAGALLAAREDVPVRAVVSRVSTAAVIVDDVVVGEIGPGLLSLVGVGRHDDEAAARALARKIHELRIFPGDDGERSAADLGLPILIVSQFTLYADTRKGRRPSWQDAAVGEVAEPLVEAVVDELRGRGCTVATGVFGARMHVSSVNEGPMTLLLEV